MKMQSSMRTAKGKGRFKGCNVGPFDVPNQITPSLLHNSATLILTHCLMSVHHFLFNLLQTKTFNIDNLLQELVFLFKKKKKRP